MYLKEGRISEYIVPEMTWHLPLSRRVMLGLTQGLGAPWHGLEVPGDLLGEHSPKDGKPGWPGALEG